MSVIAPVNASNNPFRSERVTTLPFRPQNATWEDMLRGLEAMQWRGAVVGPCGTGKTTLLEKLAPELETRGYEVNFYRLDSTHRSFPEGFWRSKPTSQHAILLDGAEQLSRWGWYQFKAHTRGAGALILTSHRAGLLPTWVNASTSPELLAQICAELGVPQPKEQIFRVFDAHKGNLRLCLMEFYDLAVKTP